MTDAEISHELARAIGWKSYQVATSSSDGGVWICTDVATLKQPAKWRWFDYRNPDVIWRIAEHYSVFPSGISNCDYKAAEKLGRGINKGWECLIWNYKLLNGTSIGWQRYVADTAAKSVALAVIGNNK